MTEKYQPSSSLRPANGFLTASNAGVLVMGAPRARSPSRSPSPFTLPIRSSIFHDDIGGDAIVIDPPSVEAGPCDC